MLLIAKFGGSSLADSTQFKKVKDIINDNPARQVVIVSALGKRNKNDSKITDLLFLLHAHLKYSVPYGNLFDQIKTRYQEIKDDLHLSLDLDSEFNLLESQLNKNISEDYLVSRGEYITAKLISEYLNYQFIDAKDLIIFKYDGTVDEEKTDLNIQSMHDKYNNIVIPGYYGSYPNGTIRVFSRGGSDITGALAAKALKASMYENWTDVSGILMADPKVIANPKQINQITYNELRELSYMGANVLHEETIIPVQELNIPINILNTNDKKNKGTIITNKCSDDTQIITGIAGKKNFASFTITKTYASNKTEVIRETLEIFERYQINIEHIPSSIDSFSVVVAKDEINKCLYDIISDIKKNQNILNVDYDDDLALVATVGRNMATKPGVSGKLFAIIGMKNISIKMIAQGSHEINIIVGVSNQHFESTIQAIYENMVK